MYGKSTSFGLLPAASSFVVVLLLSLRVAVLRNPLQDELLGRCGLLVVLLKSKCRVPVFAVHYEYGGPFVLHYLPWVAFPIISPLQYRALDKRHAQQKEGNSRFQFSVLLFFFKRQKLR